MHYLYFTLFLVLFQIVYSIFSHGVGSLYMKLAFLFPLVLGVFISLLYTFGPGEGRLASDFRQMGIVSLSIGSILHGVFDIYGSEAALVSVFFYAGAILVLVSFISYIFYRISYIEK